MKKPQYHNMELNLFPLILLTTIILAVILKNLQRKNQPYNSQRCPPPPKAAGAWPIIGHLRQLGRGSQPPHVTLGKLADKYGPIFTVHIGVHRAVVVSDWKIAKECFTTNDIVFSNRPKAIAVEHMAYNYAMFGFSPYGPYWRELKKITTLELLSNHRLRKLGHVRESEVRSGIKAIHERWSENERVLVDMKKWFMDLTMNVSLRTIVGKRWEESGDRYQRAIKDFFRLLGTFAVGDAVPWLRWIDFGGYEKEVKKTARELDETLQVWLDEHKRNRHSHQQDFMAVLISILDKAEQFSGYDADLVIKSTCLSLILGGTETTSTALTSTMAVLLSNREALRRVQQELDEHVGKERQVNESDINNLVYLQAVLKETLRIYPVATLLPPRESSADCTLAGYHIPSGTRLFVNVSKIQRDPNVWTDPNEFRPERFLTTHQSIDVKGQSFELIPFGAGRRVCSGVSFSLHVILLALASLLHSFDITTVAGEGILMRDSLGLSNVISSTVDVHVSPRISIALYD